MYEIRATHVPNSQDMRWAVRVLGNLADQATRDITARWKYVLGEVENYIGASHSLVSILKREAGGDTTSKDFQVVFIEDRLPPSPAE